MRVPCYDGPADASLAAMASSIARHCERSCNMTGRPQALRINGVYEKLGSVFTNHTVFEREEM